MSALFETGPAIGDTRSAAKLPCARIGIGGPGGSGKTALIEALLPKLTESGLEVGVITNDLVTSEDADRLRRGGLLPANRILAVEAGACPHTVIREDPTPTIQAADRLEAAFPGLDLIILESGGDNLASTFSLDLVDWWMFVIDTAGGDDIPRKRGPGVIDADLLVINKIDLAAAVDVDLKRMRSEAEEVRGDRPIVQTCCKTGIGIDEIIGLINRDVLFTA